MKTRSGSRGREESCSLKRKHESRGSVSDVGYKRSRNSDTSQILQHDNMNSNRNFIEVTKKSRKRTRSCDIPHRGKKAASKYQQESKHVSKDDQLPNVLSKTLSVVLEPFDMEQKCMQTTVTNHNKKKSVSNYSVRDVKITTKSLSGCSTENEENRKTGSKDSRTRKRCLQKSIHHNSRELHNSGQKNVASLSLSYDSDQGLLKSSTHQSRRQLWDASHKMSSEIRGERRKVYKKPVCVCCAEKVINNGNKARAASSDLKEKHNKRVEKSIRTSDANRAASSTQKRKNVVAASHSKLKHANCQYGNRPLTTEHNTTSSETTTTLKTMREMFKDGQSSRNKEIINCHSSSRSVTPTSCAVATVPLHMRDNASSQPASELPHLKVHPHLRQRSASAPPQLQLGDTLRTAVDTFVDLLLDVAAHLQKCTNRVYDMLNDNNFEQRVAGISRSVPSCTYHSPIECLRTSIQCMNILKGKLCAEFNVNSLSSGGAVQPAAAGAQPHGNSMGRVHLESSIKERTNTEANVEGGSISEPAPQCGATSLTAKSRNVLSAAETCITPSCNISLTEKTNDAPSPIASIDSAATEASIRDVSETVQLEANTEENTSTITYITEDSVSDSASEYGATSFSVDPRITVSDGGIFPGTSSSLTGGTKEMLHLPEGDAVFSDENNINVTYNNTGHAGSKSNLMHGHVEQVQDAECKTVDSVWLSTEEFEIKEEDETSESGNELELSEKCYSQNWTESDVASYGTEGEEADRVRSMEENECNTGKASDLSNHTEGESHMEDLGLEAQHEYDDNSTGNAVAENATSNGGNTTPAVNSRDDTDAVNNTGYNGSRDDDGDMDSGGNGNYGGVGDTNAEGASGHSTEGSVSDTSANKCGDGHSNEDGFGDANAARDGGNINEDNTGDGTAAQSNTTETEFICASECNDDHWQYVEQPYDGGYAGPNYEQIFEQDVVAVHALIRTIRCRNDGADVNLFTENEVRIYGQGVWRVLKLRDL